MVKLTEVEDEHFTDKPIPSKHDALLVSDDEEDYTDTGKCLGNSCFFSPFSPFECAYCITPGFWHHDPFENYQFQSTCPPNPAQNQVSAKNILNTSLHTQIITINLSNAISDLSSSLQ
jgi:hypothetical protein